MSVTKEKVLKTAALARIDLAYGATSPEEADAVVERMAKDLDAVVGYMATLQEVDTSSVEPLYSPMHHIAPPRQDVAESKLSVSEVLANAPRKQGSFFIVPPVI